MVDTTPKTSTINTPKNRLWLMIVLLVVVVVLWWMGKIKAGLAIGLGIILLAAIGIQTYNYDLDLGTLWRTGNIQESRTQQVTTKDGTVVRLTGNCVKPAGGDAGFDLNCSNFKTQPEAQAKYNECATAIAEANTGLAASKIMSLDVYGLDGNKNGIVCESLPGAPKETTTLENTAPSQSN